MLRVCRPGGVIGMINFTPEGAGGDFFRMLAPYVPPPPSDALPPLLWGREEHVQDLFGDRVESLKLTRHEYVEEAASAHEYHELFRDSFGPMVAVYESLSNRPADAAKLDQEFVNLLADGIATGPYRESRYRSNTCWSSHANRAHCRGTSDAGL